MAIRYMDDAVRLSDEQLLRELDDVLDRVSPFVADDELYDSLTCLVGETLERFAPAAHWAHERKDESLDPAGHLALLGERFMRRLDPELAETVAAYGPLTDLGRARLDKAPRRVKRAEGRTRR